MRENPVVSNPVAGARNLLLHCAGVKAGDYVLLVVEPAGHDHYDPALAPFLTDQAVKLGATVEMVVADPASGAESVPDSLWATIGRADHTIFLNRLGDQIRFAPLPGAGSKTMCYALDLDFLGSGFAMASYAALERIASRLAARISGASEYTIQCPAGTALAMRFDPTRATAKRAAQFTVKNFPVMIVPPVSASGLSGRLVLTQAITSTYIHSYESSVLPLSSPLTLTLEEGTITRVEGEPALVAQVTAQFERVSALFGGPQWAVNSWHSGINPLTWFPRPALTDMDRWSCVAFGSPRYAHFHMCGPAPGDICGQVFDATISFDGEALWQNGRPVFLTNGDKQSLVAHTPLLLSDFDVIPALGIAEQPSLPG